MTKRSSIIDPENIHVGDIVLVATGTWITIWVQQRLGFGGSSKWNAKISSPNNATIATQMLRCSRYSFHARVNMGAPKFNCRLVIAD